MGSTVPQRSSAFIYSLLEYITHDSKFISMYNTVHGHISQAYMNNVALMRCSKSCLATKVGRQTKTTESARS
jgi:hypothetical protein